MVFPFFYTEFLKGAAVTIKPGKKIHKGKIKSIKKVANQTFYIDIESQKPIEIQAGQFISILCGNLTLRRPFSVANFDDNTIGILFKQKGEGTKFISNLKTNDEIDFIGALGNGFEITNKKSLLIGAGAGVAPMNILKNTLNAEKIENLCVGGFTTNEDIPADFNFDKITTLDGSIGLKGSIIDYLEDFVKEHRPEIIYSCGPEIVLKAVCEIGKKYDIETQVALEKVMACGIGVCRGCVIKICRGRVIQNMTICHDGPVFKGSEVIW